MHHFDIEIAEEVSIGVAQTITVTAKDRDNNIAKDYTGTILFATPDDENTTLPAESGKFTFSDKDQGRFTFNLAITFTKLGLQTIQVFDEEDWDIKGEKRIKVIEKGGSQTPAPVGVLQIKSPTDNTTLSNNTVSITGKGAPSDQLKIFDNDVKIGETEIDSDGMFIFTALSLTDGLHNVYAKGNKDISNSVKFSIDVTPPLIDSFSIYPSGNVESGSTYFITVLSEPNLKAAQVRINGIPE